MPDVADFCAEKRQVDILLPFVESSPNRTSNELRATSLVLDRSEIEHDQTLVHMFLRERNVYCVHIANCRLT